MFISLKSFVASALLVTLAASEVSAHSIFTTSTAAATAAKRGDVTRAGTCNAAKAMAAPVTAAADGSFTLQAKSLNGGGDGASTVKSATLDTTGAGKTFNAKVTATGGVANPKTNQVAAIKMTLPAGTKCTGAGGACLVAVASTGGFGNCVAVIPAGGAAAGGAAAEGNAAAATGNGKAAAKNNKAAKGGNKRFLSMRRLERQLDEARVEVARHLAELDARDAELEVRAAEEKRQAEEDASDDVSDLDELDDDEEDFSDLDELDQ